MSTRIFKYEINKVLFGLTMILFVSIFIIICDCDLPVMQVNPEIDIYIEQIFVHKHEDKTFYNIAISYVAAYIFFMLQIYIPSKINHNHSMLLLKGEIEKYVDYILILLTILSKNTTYEEGKINIHKVDKLYIIEEGKNQIFCITFDKTFKSLLDLIDVKHNKLISNPMMSSLDKMLCEWLYAIPIKDIISLSNNVYDQTRKAKSVPIKGENIIERTHVVIKELQKKYGFDFQEYRTTDDNAKISEYCTGAVNIAIYTSNEMEIKVKLKK